METECSNIGGTDSDITAQYLSLSPVSRIFFADQFFGCSLVQHYTDGRNIPLRHFVYTGAGSTFRQTFILAYPVDEQLY